MGMDAYVMAIGPYKEKLVRFLDYPKDSYGMITEGAMVTATFFPCNTNDLSESLARALSIKPWYFDQHWIRSLDNVDWKALYDLEKFSAEWDLEHIDGLRTLFANGFILMFMPNG